MDKFLSIFQEMGEFKELTRAVSGGERVSAVGVSESQKAHLAAGIAGHFSKTVVIITHGDGAARQLFSDIQSFMGGAVYIPPGEMPLYGALAQSAQEGHEKAAALFAAQNARAVVMPVDALIYLTMPAAQFSAGIINICEGEEYNLDDIIKKLAANGYKRVDMVEGAGQFSVRGGILDVYCAGEDYPFRFEFFGDECDSARLFSPVTQLSLERIKKARIIPARPDSGAGSALSYMPGGAVYIFDEPRRVLERAAGLSQNIEERAKAEIESGSAPREKYYNEFHSLLGEMGKNAVIGFSAIGGRAGEFEFKRSVSFSVKILGAYSGAIEQMRNDLSALKKQNYRILIMAGSPSHARRIAENLSADGGEVGVYAENLPPRGVLGVFEGAIAKSFEYPLIKTVFLSAGDLFGRARKRKTRRPENTKPISSYSSLVPGDFVVHQHHGIARYLGIFNMEVSGVRRDYIKLEYRGGDFLYVPTIQLNLLYKYSAADSGASAPRISRMGGAGWAKTKARVKSSVLDLAKKLVLIYAARDGQVGHAFPPDTVWQKEFEDAFVYEPTADQIQSADEVKKDMQSPKPMDRLLCGDVGYGKTEVAARAAFKCVADGFQCAYLVPTTILAAQHWANFIERMKEYPIKIEMLSRFKTPKEQGETLKRLKSGAADIVIGTHRLLQKDVVFKKLGLLVIDEEQRFGVWHKERIKEISAGVDVLTLTATPIPRTLHMAMAGIRDMSVITQPPEERHPVQTYVLEYNGGVIAAAIENELARGGQVYYLYNRVAGIYKAAQRVEAMVKGARVLVAHGQMSETALEDTMVEFMRGEADILVCTTIIETGLDIPNVNTLIIENAENLGLAQLYQLRGRVGRSSRLAYAYLTFRRDRAMTEAAEKRLSAIKEFTEFGAGLKLALRDLEIRGAGNVLGPEQHGFMDAVGYDMYCRLLEDAVREAKGEKRERKRDVVIDIKISAFIPEGYIKSSAERIEAYKDIAGVSNEEEKGAVIEELTDRYGTPPTEVLKLLDVAALKEDAAAAGISEIGQGRGGVLFYFDKESLPDMERVSFFIEKQKGGALFSAGERPYLSLRGEINDEVKLLKKIKKALEDLKMGEN